MFTAVKNKTIPMSQICDAHLQQIEKTSTDDSQIPPLQSLGVVYSRELKEGTVGMND